MKQRLAATNSRILFAGLAAMASGGNTGSVLAVAEDADDGVTLNAMGFRADSAC